MLKINTKTRGLLELNLAVFLFCFSPTIAKLIPLSAPLLIFFRSLFAFMVLGMVIGVFKIHLRRPKNRKEFVFICFSGLFLVLQLVTVFYALKISTVAVVIIALYTNPLITAFFEPVFFHKKWNVLDLVFGGIVLFGIYLIVPDLSLSNSVTQGAFWGLVSALFLSLRSILNRKYAPDFNAVPLTFYQFGFSAFILLPTVIVYPFDLSVLEVGYLLIFCLLLTVLPFSLHMRSFKVLEAKTVALVSSWQPVFSIIIAMVILSEIPNLKTVIGGAIILTVVILETIRQRA